MSRSVFYDVGKLDQIAINLFYGWGYNFYKEENQVRADDRMVREKVTWLLGLARGMVEKQQLAYRKKYLPLPTREKPRPDPEAIEAARTLTELSAAIGEVEGVIRTLPVPENDRMTQRYREELPTLIALREQDTYLVGRADVLREILNGKDYTWILTNETDIREGLKLIMDNIETRQRVLHL
jgi:hypothetical protein